MQCNSSCNQPNPRIDSDSYSENSVPLAARPIAERHQAVKCILSLDRRVANAEIAAFGTVCIVISDPPVGLDSPLR